MQLHGTARDAAAQGMRSTTKHGFLVASGWVASQLGLVEVLRKHLTVKQKVYTYSPVDKVVEALVAILGNCRYMKDLKVDAEPTVADAAVARAWGQQRFAHFSTVCATFGKLTAENVSQLETALAEVQAPLWQQEVESAAGPHGRGLLVIDVDLSGQPVRGEAKQYTGTDFGYIQGKLARGYQIVSAFLSTDQERFGVASTLKSGKAHAQAGNCLLEIVPTVEARIGRPRRRVEWVQTCMEEQKALIRSLHQQWLRASGSGSPKRKQGLRRRMRAAAQVLAGLALRLRQYRQENLSNPSPRRIVLRADSVFGTQAVIQRLLELGYEFAIKSAAGSNAAFKRRFDAAAPEQWVEVEKNRYASEAVGVPAPALAGPFPLRQLALRRWDGNGREVRSVIADHLSH